MRKSKAEIMDYAAKMSLENTACSTIDPELYEQYAVKRGLRDKNGVGVLAGLTTISTIYPDKKVNGEVVSERGELRYRGIDINELVEGFVSQNRYGFEEVAYLLLFGNLPSTSELKKIKAELNA